MDYFVYSFQIFLLVWARMASMIYVAPVFSSQTIPFRFKAILSFIITLLIIPWAANLGYELPNSMPIYGLMIVKEFLVGLFLGFFLSLVFASFQLGTQFFATQIGLGMSQVFDPMTQEETPLLGILFHAVSILVFLSIGGLHMVIKAVADSYEIIPAVEFLAKTESFMDMAIRYFTMMFMVALKISFPIIATSMIILFCLGLIGKMAPQANIMLLGLPVQLGIGLVVILVILPTMIESFGAIFTYTINDVMLLLKKAAQARNALI